MISEDERAKMDAYAKAFEQHLPEMLKTHEGEHAAFVGENPEGFWGTNDEAYAAMVEKYGNVPMYIHRVTRKRERVSAPVLTLGLGSLKID